MEARTEKLEDKADESVKAIHNLSERLVTIETKLDQLNGIFRSYVWPIFVPIVMLVLGVIFGKGAVP